MRWKLFCDVTMQFYWVESDTLMNARRKLAKELNMPLNSIIECTV